MAKSFIPSVSYIEIFGEDGAYELIEKVKGSGANAMGRAWSASITAGEGETGAGGETVAGGEFVVVPSPPPLHPFSSPSPSLSTANATITKTTATAAATAAAAASTTAVPSTRALSMPTAIAVPMTAEAAANIPNAPRETARLNPHFELGTLNRAMIAAGRQVQVMLNVPANVTVRWAYSLTMEEDGVDIGFKLDFVGK
jgi:hypothetical protein